MSNDVRYLPQAVPLAKRAGTMHLHYPLVWAAVLADAVTCVTCETQQDATFARNWYGKPSAPDTRTHGSKNSRLSHSNQHCCSDSKLQRCVNIRCVLRVLEQDAGLVLLVQAHRTMWSRHQEKNWFWCFVLSMYPYCRIVLELFWCRIHTCVWNSLVRLNDLGIC